MSESVNQRTTLAQTVSNEKLLKEVQYLQDEYARMKKMYEDLFYNLDYDNLSPNFRLSMKQFELAFSEVFPDGTKNNSRFYMTAQEIYTEVAKTYVNKDGEDYIFLKSTVNQTAEAIQSMVSYTDLESKLNSYSTITQTAEKINLAVNSERQFVQDNYYTREQTQSQISMTASSITSTVAATYETKTNAESTYTSLNSSIVQTANSIMSTVEAKYETKDGVTQKISVVQQTADKINWLVANGTSASNFTLTSKFASLVASEINLTGFVTFDSLSTAGRTTIDAGNLSTGIFNASVVSIKNLTANRVLTSDASGTLASSVFSVINGGTGAPTFAPLNNGLGNIGDSSYQWDQGFFRSIKTDTISPTITQGIVITGQTVNLWSVINSSAHQMHLRLQGDFLPQYNNNSLCNIGSSNYKWYSGFFNSLTCDGAQLSFYGVTPISRQTGWANLLTTATLEEVITRINAVTTFLRFIGLTT